LPELKLHHRTLGTPKHDAAGKITNSVLLLQGNTGTGANWLRPSLADELFGPGQPLDATQYFMIMQDAIGRGGSSKPSDGLKGNFPQYRYRDMVESGYRLITEALGVAHLRFADSNAVAANGAAGRPCSRQAGSVVGVGREMVGAFSTPRGQVFATAALTRGSHWTRR
jgi:hypothetical protein